MTGPPPWENDTIFRLVNGYHLAAAKNLCSMTKCERHQAAIDVIATLPSEDRIDLNELDKVRLTNISPCSVWLLLTMLFPLFRCCFQMWKISNAKLSLKKFMTPTWRVMYCSVNLIWPWCKWPFLVASQCFQSNVVNDILLSKDSREQIATWLFNNFIGNSVQDHAQTNLWKDFYTCGESLDITLESRTSTISFVQLCQKREAY